MSSGYLSIWLPKGIEVSEIIHYDFSINSQVVRLRSDKILKNKSYNGQYIDHWSDLKAIRVSIWIGDDRLFNRANWCMVIYILSITQMSVTLIPDPSYSKVWSSWTTLTLGRFCWLCACYSVTVVPLRLNVTREILVIGTWIATAISDLSIV
jgi:hypothetical protein